MSQTERYEYPDFSGLLEIVNSLKDELGAVSDIKKITSEGMSAKLKDLAISPDGIYMILKDGIIKKVSLCIDEKDLSVVESEAGPKYHIFLCDTIKNYMYLQNNSPKKARQFKIFRGNPKLPKPKVSSDQTPLKNALNKNKPPEKGLSVCMSCLRHYNLLTGKNITADEFNLKNFLQKDLSQNAKDFISDYDLIPGVYEENWQQLSTLLKIKNEYKCEKCSVTLVRPGLQKFLNIHYSDQYVQNKRIDTIKTLCIKCHAEEENHHDIRKTPNYKEFTELMNKRNKNQ